MQVRGVCVEGCRSRGGGGGLQVRVCVEGRDAGQGGWSGGMQVRVCVEGRDAGQGGGGTQVGGMGVSVCVGRAGLGTAGV